MKKTLSIFLAILMVIAIIPVVLAAENTTPPTRIIDGELYYEIDSADDLYWFAEKVNSSTNGSKDVFVEINAILTADIVINKNLTEDSNFNGNGKNFREWSPIGWVDDLLNYGIYFNGTFDGAGHTISGLFNNSEKDYMGFFGAVYMDAVIKDLGIIDSYFHGGMFVGGLVAGNFGDVTNCYNKGTVIGNISPVGGLIGGNWGRLDKCYNTGKVVLNNSELYLSSAGGLVGKNYDADIIDCYNSGSVEGVGYIGGLVGYNYGGYIEYSYNKGELIAGDNNTVIGGIVAYSENSEYLNNHYLDTEETDELEETFFRTLEEFESGDVCYDVYYHSYTGCFCFCGAANHTLTPVNAQAPTCKNIGWDAYNYCAVCDYNEYVEIPATNHKDTLIKADGKAATCSETGYEAYEYCTACDYTTYKVIPSNGHAPLKAITENNVAPKCGVAGSYDLVVYCDDCGEELDRETVAVDALTHTDDDGDYLCDNSCGYEYEKPTDTEPETPDESETPDEPEVDCEYCEKEHENIIDEVICWFSKVFRPIISWFTTVYNTIISIFA